MNRILLVDDDLNFRRSLLIQLELDGYEVTAVGNAQEGISCLDRSSRRGAMPDVLITDLRMYPMDGETFVHRVQERYPSLPIVIISAFDLPSGMEACSFLRKPFRLEELTEQMSRAVCGKSTPASGE